MIPETQSPANQEPSPAGKCGSLSVIAGSALLSIYKDGWTGGIQLSIGDKNGGYRIAGPKFNGSGKPILEYRLTDRDAKEIRYYLDRAFPQNKPI